MKESTEHASENGAGEREASRESPWESFSLAASYIKKHWGRIVLGFLALMVVDVLQLIIPRVIKLAVDALQEGTATPSLLLLYGGYMVLIALGIAALRYWWRYLLLGFSRIMETDLRNRMMSRLLVLDRAFYQRRTPGEIMALTTNDLSSVQLAMGMGLVALFDALFMGMAAMAFMAYISPTLTLIAIAPMPVLALLTRVLSGRLHRRFRKVQEQFSTMTEFVRSTFSSIRLIKAYNQEPSQVSRFNDLGEVYVRDNLRLAGIQGILFPVSGFIGSLSLLLVLFYGGRMAIEGLITVGDLVAFIAYLFLLTWPMMALGWVTNLFQRGVTSLWRIQSLLDEKPVLEGPSAAPAAPFPKLRGGIELKKLSFTFPGAKEPVLDGLDLQISPGTFLGIVGRTGSGKTTLCHLLARLYPIENGMLHLDGRDVNTLPLNTVRESLAYVPQDVTLFSNTIAHNIAMGRGDASREEIEATARAASIHDEIMAMKDGYDTRIGEKGVKLSGGQRQRVALARALLLDRPILIIDDGLSAVDMETEHAIIRSMASYLSGRTCIVVSHRVAPLADADRILVLEEGRIVEAGTHEHLLGRGGFYTNIHRQQTMGD